MDSPSWVAKLGFEVKTDKDFQFEAWDLWKPTLQLLSRVITDKKWKLNWVKIHSHLGAKRSPRHSQAWVDKDTDTMMLCHFDKDTMLHEVSHLPKDDAHSDAWALRLWRLQENYLSKKDLALAQQEITRYRSGRRLYIKKFGVQPPKHEDQVSIWVHTNPASK